MKFFPSDKAHKLALVGFHAQQLMDRNCIVLDFDMEMYGHTLKCAPDFLQRIHKIVVDEKCEVRKVSSRVEICGVDFEMFRLDPDDQVLRNDGEVVLTLSKTILGKLSISRPNKPILLEKEVRLHFTLAYQWDADVWRWAQNFFSTAFWVKFSGSQVEFAAPKEEEAASQGVLDAVANLAETVQKSGGSIELSTGDGESLLKIDEENAEKFRQRAGRKPTKKGGKK